MKTSRVLDGFGLEASSLTYESENQLGIMDMESSCPEQIVRLKVMLAAMVHHLILDLRGEGVTNKHGDEGASIRRELKRNGEIYVNSDDIDPYSFLWLCDSLNVDVRWFREEVRTGRICQWKLLNGTTGQSSFVLQPG